MVLGLLTRGKQDLRQNPYSDTSTEELMEIWNHVSRRGMRGIGKALGLNPLLGGGVQYFWRCPTDVALEQELLGRGVPRGEYRGDGFCSPKSDIPPEEAERYRKETFAILEEHEGRLVVIDTCAPKDLGDAIGKYTKRSIYLTPHNHERPDIIYGPSSKGIQLPLSIEG